MGSRGCGDENKGEIFWKFLEAFWQFFLISRRIACEFEPPLTFIIDVSSISLQ
jgi:hypothetical protein